ncbi:MAG: thiaminase II/PqqC family protein, partial [Bdellovibrionota bacterium]
MTTNQQKYGVRRVYETTPGKDGTYALRMQDRVIDLGAREYGLFAKVAEWLPSNRDAASLESALGLDAPATERLLKSFEEAGLLYARAQIPATLTGEEFHRDYFSKALPSWLGQAFEHPFWQRMMSGQGSERLFAGWMIELYHYTLNANRHMSLSCAYTRVKPVKTMRAKHYAEEWNHYHYFMKSLRALGFTNADISDSVPLPMTLALSNFMRQAAREDILAYSICSAVLEGTTVDRGTYNPYYEKCAEL